MTGDIALPPLDLEGWRSTRDILRQYARCLGAIRRALSRPARHWSHIGLTVSTRGITTGPMMVAGERLEIRLDIRGAQIEIGTESGQAWVGRCPGTSCREILDRTNAWLARSGGASLIEIEMPEIENPDAFDQFAADRFWSALSRIDDILREFSGGLRGEAHGPLLWPHHFDLAVLWLSGRLVPGEDPKDEDRADESMNFGFSTGDDGIPSPYFYATAYPAVPQLSEMGLPNGARWHAQGWQGAKLDYASVADGDNPRELLLTFLTTVQQAGALAMRKRQPDP